MTMTRAELMWRLRMPLLGPIPAEELGDTPTVDLRGVLAPNGTAPAPQAVPEPVAVTAAEMMRHEAQEPVWAVQGLLADGVALLAGSPKLGKSWLGMELALCVAEGHPFLGLEVEQGESLYLALEDGARRLRRRLPFLLGKHRKAGPKRAHFATSWPTLDTGGVTALARWHDKHPKARVVIIDTWGKFAPGGMFTYMGDYETIGKVKSLAEERALPIVLVHHVTKSAGGKPGGDPLSGIAGSTGLIGSVDGVLMLTRPRGSDGGRLYVTGRDVEEATTDLVFDLSHGVWRPTIGWGQADAD